jgi:hypothetical protein
MPPLGTEVPSAGQRENVVLEGPIAAYHVLPKERLEGARISEDPVSLESVAAQVVEQDDPAELLGVQPIGLAIVGEVEPHGQGSPGDGGLLDGERDRDLA